MKNHQNNLDGILHLDYIETKKKEVFKVNGYKDKLHLSNYDDIYNKDLILLVSNIESGIEIPKRFYRKNIGIDKDDALVNCGIMHLHLGGQNSNVLVFLYQFKDHVVLIEINNHSPFEKEKPPCSYMNQQNYRKAIDLVDSIKSKKKSIAETMNKSFRNLLNIK